MSHPSPNSIKSLDPTHHQAGSRKTSAKAGPDNWTEATQKFLSEKPAEPALSNCEPAVHNTSDLAEQFRHSHWQPFRKRVSKALADNPDITQRRLSAFNCCGCDAHVEVRSLGEFSKSYRIVSTKCHDRFCLPCSKARAERIRASLMLWMHGRENLSLITLTLKQGNQPLREILDRITRCFRALRNKPLWKKAVTGGVATIEAKIGTDGKAWNVHFHVVAEAKFLRQDKLAELWLSITGDSRVVDVRRVGAKSGAVQYITKYVTKSSDHSIVMSPTHLAEAIVAFTGRRLVSTFGTWRGVQLMEKHDETEVSQFAGEWRPIGPLDEFIRRAADGSAEALFIMRQLTPNRKLAQRPGQPPPGGL